MKKAEMLGEQTKTFRLPSGDVHIKQAGKEGQAGCGKIVKDRAWTCNRDMNVENLKFHGAKFGHSDLGFLT